MRLLGASCHNLKSFSLTLFGPDSFERSEIIRPACSKEDFFPKMEALFLDGDFTLRYGIAVVVVNCRWRERE